MAERRTIKINEADNVAVAVVDLTKGETCEGVVLANDIPKGHKFALTEIEEGGKVIKYGNPIARATAQIHSGEHVHTHNAATCLSGNLEYSYSPEPYFPKEVKRRTVNVYRRANGAVGIRNELWIIPVTGSVNAQAKLILKTFKNRFGNSGADGVFALTHPYGGPQTGGGKDRVTDVLHKMIRHPNAGGVLVLGLGNIENFRKSLGAVDESRVKFLDCLEVEDEIEAGVQLLNKIAEVAAKDVREAEDISCLKIGLKCSDSDSLSGVTANPLIGRLSDYIAAAGGTAVLCEVPETFGAEQLLMNRAKENETFEKLLALINGYKDYFRSNGKSVYQNPTPADMADGITTIEEKSVARTQKSGSSPVCDVVSDGEAVTQKGLNVLNGPDDDMCAVTNLAASGCHLVLFATGRGTPVGGVIPVIKISSNSALAAKKSNWIDFDAGSAIDSGYDAALEKLADLVASVAGGKLTKNEVNNSREIAITKTVINL